MWLRDQFLSSWLLTCMASPCLLSLQWATRSSWASSPSPSTARWVAAVVQSRGQLAAGQQRYSLPAACIDCTRHHSIASSCHAILALPPSPTVA